MRTSKTWRTPKPVTKETALKNQVKHYLGLKGLFCFHVLQGLGSYRGISDLIALRYNRQTSLCETFFIELKAPNGAQSEHQRRFQEAVEEKGGRYILCKSIEDLIQAGL